MRPRVPAWESVIAMERWISAEGMLELPGEARAQLQVVALDVAMAEAEVFTALRTPEGMAALVREVCRRVLERGKEYSCAMDDARDLQEEGDTSGARQVLEEYIASEPIPKYREFAAAELKNLE